MTKIKKNNLRTAQFIIRFAALIGLLDSIYLSYVKFSQIPIYCTPGLGDCATVNSSRWSELWGIPIALFGMLAFGTILLLSLYGNRVKFTRFYNDYLIFGISLVGLLFSTYLTYLEAFVIRAFCQWCVLSAISVLVVFIASLVMLLEKNGFNQKEEIYAKN